MLKILTAPNPILHKVAKPVKKVNQELINLIEQMKETLLATKDPIGVGLAAQQVGKSLALFIAKPWPKSPFTVFMNPHIIWMSEEKTEAVPERKNKYEGCLSIPDIWGLVHRAKKVKLSYQTLKPSQQTTSYKLRTTTRTFQGFMATIVQHEVDHLNGVLFPRRVLEQKEKFYKLSKEGGKDVFEEIEI